MIFCQGFWESLGGLVEAVRAKTESTKIILEHMQETQDRNNNDHGEGNRNCVGEAHIVNLSYQGLSEFRKATPPHSIEIMTQLQLKVRLYNQKRFLRRRDAQMQRRWPLPPMCQKGRLSTNGQMLGVYQNLEKLRGCLAT